MALLRIRIRLQHQSVMAGLGPANHVLLASPKVVDARAKPGHDESAWGGMEVSA
jgi:hypothetical protein